MSQKLTWFIFGVIITTIVFIGSGLTIGEHCYFLTPKENVDLMIAEMQGGWIVTHESDIGNAHLICLRITPLGALFP